MHQKIGEEIKCADLIGKRWMCSQEIANLFGNDFNEFCKSIVEKGECEFYNNVREKKALTIEAKVLLSELLGARHNEEIMASSKEKRMCGYEISLALAKKATVIIGDYYYLFSPRVQDALFTKLEWSMEDIIVIVDEWHNLPSRIAEMLSTNLSSFMVRNALIEAKKHNYGGLIPWLQELNAVLVNLADFKEKEKEKFVSKEQFVAAVNKTVKYDDLLNELEVATD